MVLIFSKVQRCNVKGALYKYQEQFDASEELAHQLVDAGVCGYVEQPKEQPKAERQFREDPAEAAPYDPLPEEELKVPEAKPEEKKTPMRKKRVKAE